MDIRGDFIEAIGEQDDEALTVLARMVRDNQNGTHTEAIGKIFSGLIIEYCEPDADAVKESMGIDGGY